MKELISLIGAVTLVGILLFYGPICYGFVAMKFYNWYGLKDVLWPSVTLTYWNFVGMILLFAVMRPGTSASVKSEYKEESTVQLATGILMPWIVFLIGWLFKIIFF